MKMRDCIRVAVTRGLVDHVDCVAIQIKRDYFRERDWWAANS